MKNRTTNHAKKIEQEYDIIHLTFKCNLKCIFCSNDPEYLRLEDPFQRCLKQIQRTAPKKVTIEGGEPTLDKRLSLFIRKLRSRGTKEIILATNGVLLSNKKFAQDLLDTGIDLFNINFSSCRKTTSRLITGNKMALSKKQKGVENLVALGGKNKTRLTFVINSLNYAEMPDYIRFVNKKFPGILYVAFNMIKVMGGVKKRTHLVPKLSDAAPYLLEALILSRKYGIKIITDGIPLCFMPDFTDSSIDTYKKSVLGYKKIDQKYMPDQCLSCLMNFKCGGLRKDYAELFGESEIKAFL